MDVRAPSQPAYRRLTRADLELIAHRHVRGASDGAIARELDVDRSSVRRARKRPAALELIAAERKRELKRAESQRYRDRKKERERAEREADPAAEVANQSEHAAHQEVNPPSLSGEPGYRRQRQEGGSSTIGTVRRPESVFDERTRMTRRSRSTSSTERATASPTRNPVQRSSQTSSCS